MQFAYADEADKAKFIALQWIMTSLGGTVGSSIAFGLNFHETQPQGVSTPVYAVLIAIMGLAVFLALLVVDPENVVRGDGTHLATFTSASITSELRGVLACFKEPRIVLLLPAMIVAEATLVLMSSINGECF